MQNVTKFLLIAATVAAFSSCAKEGNPSSQNGGFLTASFNSAEACKVSLNGSDYTQSWEAGDQLYLYQPATSAYGTLATEGSGSKVAFTGDLAGDSPVLSPTDPCYFFTPASCVNGKDEGVLTLNVNRDQTGYIEDFGKHYISYSEGIIPTAIEGGYSFSSDAALKNLLPVVKLNIASGLGVKRIDVIAYNSGKTSARHTAGSFYFNPATGEVTKTEDDAAKYDVRIIRRNESQELQEISGDLYIVFKPSHDNGAEALEFTFKQDTDGTLPKYSYFAVLSKPLERGEIRDLGNITRITWPELKDLPETKISVKNNDKENASVLCTNTESDVKYYYTTDGSLPTESSTVYNASISVGESCYLRILATKEGFKTQITNAMIKFYKCPSIEEATEYKIISGGTRELGFATFKNIVDSDVTLKINTGSTFIVSQPTSDVYKSYRISTTTEHKGKGTWYVRFKINNSSGSSEKKRYIYTYYNGANDDYSNSKKVTVAAKATTKDWAGPGAIDIEAGKETAFSQGNSAESIFSFLWLEYGFEWPQTSQMPALTNEKIGE